jgi:hypothetical protein
MEVKFRSYGKPNQENDKNSDGFVHPLHTCTGEYIAALTCELSKSKFYLLKFYKHFKRKTLTWFASLHHLNNKLIESTSKTNGVEFREERDVKTVKRVEREKVIATN